MAIFRSSYSLQAGEFGMNDDDDEDEEEDGMGNARYEDFFTGKKEKGSKRKAQLLEESKDSGDEDDMELDTQKKGAASTHEKQLEKLQSKIEQMEKANVEPKTWAMQGEITAAKRPKNSALEVDIDFEHNMRPAPVITEEFTASIEDMIQKSILEDDNKSKQGLAEIYEDCVS